MIKSAKFSFVRFEHPEDNDYSLDIPYSLPAFDQHNVAFQFVVDNDRSTEQAIKLGIADEGGSFISAFAGPVNAEIVAYRYKIEDLSTQTTFSLSYINVDGELISYGGMTVTPALFRQIMFDDFGIEVNGDYFVLSDNVTVIINASIGMVALFGTLPVYWHQGFVTVSGVDIDSDQDCFTYALLEVDNSVLGYSNHFKVVEEEAFTSVMTYYCNEDGFEFFYVDSTKANIVRLWMHLTQPQFPKTRNVDRKSDGTKRVLSSYVEKEYQIETEQTPEVFHECLAIALSHDNIAIHNVNIREVDVEVVESDNYAPKWDTEEGSEKTVPFGKGKGKVKVASYGYTNSNC
jgi:hypothetical protein